MLYCDFGGWNIPAEHDFVELEHSETTLKIGACNSVLSKLWVVFRTFHRLITHATHVRSRSFNVSFCPCKARLQTDYGSPRSIKGFNRSSPISYRVRILDLPTSIPYRCVHTSSDMYSMDRNLEVNKETSALFFLQRVSSRQN
jgi:hypothetical protein